MARECDPRKGKRTITRPGRNAIGRRGATFAFLRINKPIPGCWRILTGNVRLTEARDRAKASITTPKRKR